MRHAIHVVGMISTGFIFYVLIGIECDYLLFHLVIHQELDKWLDIFRHWAFIVVLTGWATALIWYILGSLVFKVNEFEKSNRRPVWLLLGILPIIAIIWGGMATPVAQAGTVWAWVIYVINGLGVYYVSTVLFSPSSFKYNPCGAAVLRPRAW